MDKEKFRFTRMVACIVAITGVCLFTMVPAAFCDEPMEPYPMVTSSSSGEYYFTMIPERRSYIDQSFDVPPFGVAYRLLSDGSSKQLWKVVGWYAFEVYLADGGKYLVRMGNWALGSVPSKANLAVAFYERGKLLASYSTLDLIENDKSVERTATHYFWKSNDGDFPRFDRMFDNFQLKTIEDNVFVFNYKTGELIKTLKP